MKAIADETGIDETVSLAKLWSRFRAKLAAGTFLQDVGVLTSANFISAAVSLVQGILVARWLGPEHYGVVGLVLSYPNFVYAFFDARSSEASVKYLSDFHGRGEHAGALAICRVGYGVDLAVACVTFLILVLTSRFAAQTIVHDPAVGGLMVLYGAALIPRALVGTSSAIFITLGRFTFNASIDIATNFLRLFLVVSFVLAGWQVQGVVWASAITAAAAGFLYGAVALMLIRRTWEGSLFRGGLKALKGGRRKMFSFLAYNNLNTLIGTIPNQLDLILLGFFRGPTEVGYFRLAKNISMVVRFVIKPLQTVTYPALARLAALGQGRAYSEKVRKLWVWVGLPSGVVVLVGAASISSVLPLLVGEAYLPAVGAAQLMIFGGAFAIAFFWTRPVYLSKGYVRQMFIFNSSVTVLFGLFYPFVIYEWGYLGSAAWLMALQIVSISVSVPYLWRQMKKSD